MNIVRSKANDAESFSICKNWFDLFCESGQRLKSVAMSVDWMPCTIVIIILNNHFKFWHEIQINSNFIISQHIHKYTKREARNKIDFICQFGQKFTRRWDLFLVGSGNVLLPNQSMSTVKCRILNCQNQKPKNPYYQTMSNVAVDVWCSIVVFIGWSELQYINSLPIIIIS